MSNSDGTVHTPATASERIFATLPCRILLIDDDEFINDIISSTFENSPELIVENCRTATGGLDRVRENPPDLILMDLGLPDMDGLDLLQILKSEQSSRGIPVMVLSGIGDPRTRVSVYRMGAEWFLEKPFRPHILKELVLDIISLTHP